MTVKILSSSDPSAATATESILKQAGDMKPTFVLWFASPKLEPEKIAEKLSSAFPGATCIGCTSSGELASGKMLKGALVALVADAETIPTAYASLIEDVKSGDSTKAALYDLAERAGSTAPSKLDPSQLIGLVLQDGMSGAEELVMANLSGATNVAFVGGSAGDDLAFQATKVFVGNKGGSGRGALALLAPKNGFRILKTQSFSVKDTVLEVTECDPGTRTVISFNDEPAAEAYAKAVGVPVSELSNAFGRNPLGLLVEGGEPFVRSPREIQGTKVAFYCEVLPEMKLHLLQATNIVEQTKKDLASALESFGNCSAIINFHCILRTLELEATEACNAYGAIFNDVPMIGLSTYGESYVGHINQTSTMVLIG